uniref:Uncharacterized protein n=1 Tax=Lygus hesperus TaxID=30085 RepID=A0A0A9W749_LYGHE
MKELNTQQLEQEQAVSTELRKQLSTLKEVLDEVKNSQHTYANVTPSTSTTHLLEMRNERLKKQLIKEEAAAQETKQTLRQTQDKLVTLQVRLEHSQEELEGMRQQKRAQEIEIQRLTSLLQHRTMYDPHPVDA